MEGAGEEMVEGVGEEMVKVRDGGRYGRRRGREGDGSCRSGRSERPPVLKWLSGMEGRRLLLLPFLVGLLGKTTNEHN